MSKGTANRTARPQGTFSTKQAICDDANATDSNCNLACGRNCTSQWRHVCGWKVDARADYYYVLATSPHISVYTMRTRITFGWPGSTQYPSKHKRTKGKKLGLHPVTGFYTWIAVLLEPSSSYATRLRRLTFSFHPRPQTKLQRQFHTLQSALRNWFAVDIKARLRNMTYGNKISLDVAVRTCHSLHRRHAAHSWIQSLLYVAPNRALRCRTATLSIATEKLSRPLYGKQFRDTRTSCTIEIAPANSMGVCAHPMQAFRLTRTPCVQTVLGTRKWSNSHRSSTDTVCGLHDLFCRNVATRLEDTNKTTVQVHITTPLTG